MRERRFDQSVASHCDLEFFPQTSVDSWRYRSVLESHLRLKLNHDTGVNPALNPTQLLAKPLQEVDRRMTFVDHDAN